MEQEMITAFVGIAIAVIALGISIVALCAQTKQLKLQNYMDYTKRYQEIILHFPETINENTFELEELCVEKKEKTMRYMRVYYDLCFEEFDLNSKGFIDPKFWCTWKGGMKAAFDKAAFRQAWKKIQKDTDYRDEFIKFVDCCQNKCEQPHPVPNPPQPLIPESGAVDSRPNLP